MLACPGRQSSEPATSVICSHSHARFSTCIAGGETDYKLPHLHFAVARRSIRLRGLGHNQRLVCAEHFERAGLVRTHCGLARHGGTTNGCGGIYYHLWGNMDPHVAERVLWLSRPRGMEFRPLLEGISQTATAPVSVWRRFMVLSPGLEFVMLGNASLELRIPNGWVAHRVTRTVLS
jgi:hypothetical protein